MILELNFIEVYKKMHHNSKISKDQKISDWIKLRNLIDQHPHNKSNWEIVFNQFLMDRVKSRYLDPISEIKKNTEGAGFAVVIIQCSLIEFLETTITGETYKHHRPNQELFEYNNSAVKFKNFLKNRFPFNKHFSSNLANKFYKDVRNGLIHEGQTKRNWLIRMDNKKSLIETKNGMRVFDRSRFHTQLNIFFKRYREQLIQEENLQKALRREINVISKCSILE